MSARTLDGRHRLLMVTPSFAPHRGGVETHVHEVGRRLVASGRFSVEVLTTDRSGALPARDEIDGMRVTRVRAYPGRLDLYWAPAVRHRIRRASVDLVHVQGYHTFVPPLAMASARSRDLPYVVTFHSGGHSSALRHAVRPLQTRALRPMLRAAAGLVAVSRFEAALFAARLGVQIDRIAVIPNGADLPEGSDPGPMPKEAGHILSIGRLERYKGHRRVIEALPRVRATVPAARLTILGDGDDEPRLRAIARDLGVDDAVHIGGVPREELPRYLRSAGAVALLSSYESHGIAVQEALALGARVVVSDASALAEVADLPQVRAVPVDAPVQAVADALIDQLAAPPVPADAIPPLPTWDACAERLADLYEVVIESRRGSAS